MDSENKELQDMEKMAHLLSIRTLIIPLCVLLVVGVIYFSIMKSFFHDSYEEFNDVTCAILCDVCDIEARETEESWISAGTFGDMFGALTCLFTGLGVAGVLVTLKLQYKTYYQMRIDSNKRHKESKELYKQSERHWFFSLASGIAHDWDKDKGEQFKEKLRKALEEAILAEEERKECIEFLKIIWNLAVQARISLKRYNVIPYNLTVSSLFEEDEIKDIIVQTNACLPEDLRFCLSTLYLNGALPKDFCCKDVIVNDKKYEMELLETCVTAVNHRDSARIVLCQLKCIGRKLVNVRL